MVAFELLKDSGAGTSCQTFGMAANEARMPRLTKESVDPARVRAWELLSELFLDTELDDDAIAAIARDLRATGLGVAELERIYEDEVAPACWRNALAVPGGVWTGFDRDWLVAEVQRRLLRRRFWERIPWLKRLLVRRRTSYSRADWTRLRDRLTRPAEEP